VGEPTASLLTLVVSHPSPSRCSGSGWGTRD